MSKRKAPDHGLHVLNEKEGHAVQITPLGAGQEVGRSCIIMMYEGKSVMFDCGIHPGYSGQNSLPYLDGTDLVDISKVQVALITHFHLDHCAAVPHLLYKTRFKGRIFMTHPTKAIYYSLIKDFARAAKGQGSTDQALYSEEDVEASMERIEVIDFMQTLEVAPDIQVTALRAGHVLGAAMFQVEVSGCRVLYTGDYSRVPDRHLPAADIPQITPHILIVESTYGVSRHLPRDQREALFLQRITDTLRAGGRVLLPVVALGRAQELLLMLDEYWAAHPELHGVPIYQASGQMSKSMRVYETYVEMMNDDIKAVFQHHNPFAFRHVTHLKNANHFDDVGPCVMMATPSGLQSGASRDAFEAWCDDRRNSVIIVDFAVQGTLAREILGGPKDILTKTGFRVVLQKPLRCNVVHISFSAHADYEQTSGFLDTVRPPNVVLVHGEKNEMMRLKGALEKGAAELGCERNVYTPAVMQTVHIRHQPVKMVRVAGRLAAKPPHEGSHLTGVLVAQQASGGMAGAPQPLLLHPDDLPVYTKLHRGRVTQRQALATNLAWSDLRLALEVMFEGVDGSAAWSVTTCHTPAAHQPTPQPTSQSAAGPDDKENVQETATEQAQGTETAVQGAEQAGSEQQGQQQEGGSGDDQAMTVRSSSPPLPQAVCVGDMVTVRYQPNDLTSSGCIAHVMVEWEGGKVSDMVADAVVAVLLQANAARDGTPATVQAAESALQAAHAADDQRAIARAECEAVAALLATQFGPAHVDQESAEVHVQVGGGTSVPGPVTHVTVCPTDGKVICTDPTLRARIQKTVTRLLNAMRPISLTTT